MNRPAHRGHSHSCQHRGLSTRTGTHPIPLASGAKAQRDAHWADTV